MQESVNLTRRNGSEHTSTKDARGPSCGFWALCSFTSASWLLGCLLGWLFGLGHSLSFDPVRVCWFVGVSLSGDLLFSPATPYAKT